MAEAFPYGRASKIIDLRDAYQAVSDAVRPPATAPRLSVPLILRDGTAVQYEGGPFPTGVLLRSWYGIPELFRQYWRDLADLCEQYPYRFDKDVDCTLDPIAPVTPDSTIQWDSGEGADSNPSYQHYHNVLNISGVYAITVPPNTHVSGSVPTGWGNEIETPEWHGSKDDGFYPVLAYTELLSQASGLWDYIPEVDTAPADHEIANTHYEGLTRFDWARWPYMPREQGNTVVWAWLCYEFVNTTSAMVRFPISASISGTINGAVVSWPDNVQIVWRYSVPNQNRYLYSDIFNYLPYATGESGASMEEYEDVAPGGRIRGIIGCKAEFTTYDSPASIPVEISLSAPRSLGRTSYAWSAGTIVSPY